MSTRDLNPEYISVRRAATLLDASDKTVRRWLAQADDPLPCYRIGHGRWARIRIPRRELMAWLERRRSEPPLKQIIDEIVSRVTETGGDGRQPQP